jgi:hypothetical protein
MRDIINNIKILLIAIIGVVGGGFWAYSSNWEYEPIILIVVSFFEIGGYFFIQITDKNNKKTNTPKQIIVNNGKINKQINIQKNKGKIEM